MKERRGARTNVGNAIRKTQRALLLCCRYIFEGSFSHVRQTILRSHRIRRAAYVKMLERLQKGTFLKICLFGVV